MKKQKSCSCLLYVIQMAFIFSLFLFPKQAQSEKKSNIILCRELSKEILAKTRYSKKEIPKGLVVVITSADQSAVTNIQNILYACNSREKKSMQKNPATHELLLVKGVKAEIIELNNGVWLELTANSDRLVNTIKKLKFPGSNLIRSSFLQK